MANFFYRRALTASLFVITYCIAVAQNRWEPGHVVLYTGDTLFGILKSKADVKNSQYIRFKQRKTDAFTKYTPEQIQSYFLSASDKWYLPVLVPTDTTKGTKRFLQVIVDGEKADYYYLRDRMDESRYFMSVRNGKVIELRQIKTVKYAQNDLGELIKKTQMERIDLDSMKRNFADCRQIVTDPKFNSTEHQFRPLAKKVFAYNKCLAPEKKIYVASRLKNSAAIELLISGGIGYSTVLVDGYKNDLLTPKGVTSYSVGTPPISFYRLQIALFPYNRV